MKKIFTQAGLERLLFDLQFGARLERLNLGRNYRFTLPGGGNPFAAAAAEPGETINALMWVDETTSVGATVTAHLVSEISLPKGNVEESDPVLWGSLAASGRTRKKQSRDVDATSFEVTVEGYNVRGATVEDGESCAGSALESGRHVFPDSEHNDCVASASAQASVRARPDVKSESNGEGLSSESNGGGFSSESNGGGFRDEEDFWDHFLKNYDYLFNYIRARVPSIEDTEDLLHETATEAHRTKESYRGDCESRYWFRSIAINRIANFYRRQERSALISLQAIENVSSADDDGSQLQLEDVDASLPWHRSARRESTEHLSDAKTQLSHAMTKLSDLDQRIVYLYYEKQHKLSEIADETGQSYENIRQHHVRVLEKLRGILSREGVDRSLIADCLQFDLL